MVVALVAVGLTTVTAARVPAGPAAAAAAVVSAVARVKSRRRYQPRPLERSSGTGRDNRSCRERAQPDPGMPGISRDWPSLPRLSRRDPPIRERSRRDRDRRRRSCSRSSATRGSPAAATTSDPGRRCAPPEPSPGRCTGAGGGRGTPTARRGTARGHVRRGRGDAVEHARRGHGVRRRGPRCWRGASPRSGRERVAVCPARAPAAVAWSAAGTAGDRARTPPGERWNGESVAGGGRRAHQVLRSDEGGPARGLVGEVGGHLRARAMLRMPMTASMRGSRDVHLLHLVARRVDGSSSRSPPSSSPSASSAPPKKPASGGFCSAPPKKPPPLRARKITRGGRCGRQSRDEGKTVPNAVSGFRRARATDRARRGRSIARGVSPSRAQPP